MSTRTPRGGTVTMSATTFARLLHEAFERGQASTPKPEPGSASKAFDLGRRVERRRWTSSPAEPLEDDEVRVEKDDEPTYSQGVLDGMQLGRDPHGVAAPIDESFKAYLAGLAEAERRNREDQEDDL